MSIVLSNLAKSFGRVRAVHGVEQTIRSQAVTVLVGPSGCGKTTLLRLIAGLEIADEGRIVIDGVDVTNGDARKRGVGFVFQSLALFPHMTVEDNIAFALSIRGQSRAASSARVAELLDAVQLPGYQKRFPRELSGGQRQRVAFARTLAAEPRILLLDEPFGSLDVPVRRELRAWLRELHERTGLTTVLVTHDPDEARDLADDMIVMQKGLVAQTGTPEDLARRPSSAFVADFLGVASAFESRARLEAGVAS